MKKLFALAAFACLLFTSCSDDDDTTYINYLSINGEKIEMPRAYLLKCHEKGYSYYALLFSASDVQQRSDIKTAAEFAFAYIDRNEENGAPIEGTYTYIDDSKPEYDPAKHYYDITYLTRDTNNGLIWWDAADMTNTTVVIKKKGNGFIFDYSFIINEKSYIGHYEGNVIEIDGNDFG